MDCLEVLYTVSSPYAGFAKPFAEKNSGKTVYDLCAGGGKSVEFLLKHLDKNPAQNPPHIIATDLQPDITSLEILKQRHPKNFDYIKTSVTVFDPPSSENCSYCIFTAFHHFNEDDAVKIIQNMLIKSNSFTIFELTSRHNIISYFWLIPGFFSFIATPFFAKKWRWQKALFSIIPIIPFMVAFDGLISNLRTYTKQDLERLASLASKEKKIKIEFEEKRYMLLLKAYMCRFYYEE